MPADKKMPPKSVLFYLIFAKKMRLIHKKAAKIRSF